MRKITKSLMLFAATAMAFASCAKEEAPVSTSVDGTIRVKFVADAALSKVGLNPNVGDTEFTASWDDDDQIAITSFESGGAMKETKDAIWSSDDKCFITDFNASDYTEGSYDFVGVWPVGKDADKLFPAERHQNGAVYNGEYDIMKSSRTSSATLSEYETIILDMVRQTSIAYFHITSALNEKIVSATLTTDQPIASSNATLDHSGFEPNVGTDGVKSIKLIIDGEMSSSDFKLWFNVLPVKYETMTLRVETENHSFSLEKKTGGEWKAGELNMAVIKNVPEEKWAEIEKPTGEVTETLTMTEKTADDNDVITFTNGNITAEFAKAGANNSPAWNKNSSELRLYAGGKLTISAGENSITKITYVAVKNAGGSQKVIPTPSANVGMLDDENSTWTGNANSVVISLSGSAGNYGFKSITVTYSDLNAETDPIYKYSVMADPEIKNGTVNIDPAAAAAGTTVTLTPAPDEGYELLSEDNLEVYNAVVGKEKGKIELTPTEDGKYTFTMPAANVNVTAQFSLIPTLKAEKIEGVYNEQNEAYEYASNTTENKGSGFSIPIIANQAWVAAIKTGDPNDADIELMTAEGDGGESNNLVFKFKNQNTSPLAAKSTVVVLSPKKGGRPDPVEITITHNKRVAKLVLNNVDKANVTDNVAAIETSYTVNITEANFSEWSVLEYKIGDAVQSTTDENCVTNHDDGAYTGSVTIGFPVNASESNEVTITLKVGYEGIITKTLTLTQAPAVARTPNVTLDFSTNIWGLPTAYKTESGEYSDGNTTITLVGTGSDGYKYNSTDKYLILGKLDATLTFQDFDFDVDRIKVYGRTGASSSVTQNIFVGSDPVSTPTMGATGTNTYDINADYQAAGNIYVLKVTNSANTQITKIEIFGGARKTLTGLAISGTPTKTTYTEGEVFDPAGLTVTATYDDGSQAQISSAEWEINPNMGLTPETSSVTVIAKKGDVRSASFTVGVTVNAIPTFTIQNYEDEKGRVIASANISRAGETITLTISPVSPNSLKTLKVYKVGDESTVVPLSGSGNTITFTMPAYDVVVSAEFGQGGGEETQHTPEISFKSNSLTSGWSTNGTFNSSYYKMDAGDYAQATSEALFGDQVLSTEMKINVACGTFGTWTGDKTITLKAAFYDSSNNELSSQEFTTGTLNATQGTYRGEFTLSKPNDPSKIAYMRIIFKTLTSTSGGTARFAGVKLDYSTISK